MRGIPSRPLSRSSPSAAALLVAVGVLVPACRSTPRPVSAASAETVGRDCVGPRMLVVDNHADESVELSARVETLWGRSVVLGTVLPGRSELELPAAARAFSARGVSSGRLVAVMMPSSRSRPATNRYVELRVACGSAPDSHVDVAGHPAGTPGA